MKKKGKVDIQKIKELKEVKTKDNGRVVFAVILTSLVFIMGFLIYSFVHHYGGGIDFMGGEEPGGNGVFPNVNFGEESFDVLIDACDGKIQEDACEFERNNETVSGICRQSGGENLVCMPEMQ